MARNLFLMKNLLPCCIAICSLNQRHVVAARPSVRSAGVDANRETSLRCGPLRHARGRLRCCRRAGAIALRRAHLRGKLSGAGMMTLTAAHCPSTTAQPLLLSARLTLPCPSSV